ncbi:MAG: hypothetical protein KF814_01990 [Nitrospiraceae bacterium]|nr:hypothetical protein [Nitrospiraceae bacterium]
MDETDETLAKALALFDLPLPVTRDQLDRKHRELLRIWDPHRLANQTNNPKKYMQMVKKGEAMVREIEEAYALLTVQVVREA